MSAQRMPTATTPKTSSSATTYSRSQSPAKAAPAASKPAMILRNPQVVPDCVLKPITAARVD